MKYKRKIKNKIFFLKWKIKVKKMIKIKINNFF